MAAAAQLRMIEMGVGTGAIPNAMVNGGHGAHGHAGMASSIANCMAMSSGLPVGISAGQMSSAAMQSPLMAEAMQQRQAAAMR